MTHSLVPVLSVEVQAPPCCPTCSSPRPERHPAVQYGGDVEICVDPFHLQETPANPPRYRALVEAKRLQLAVAVDAESRVVTISPARLFAGIAAFVGAPVAFLLILLVTP